MTDELGIVFEPTETGTAHFEVAESSSTQGNS
jgi:hypothetical protein